MRAWGRADAGVADCGEKGRPPEARSRGGVCGRGPTSAAAQHSRQMIAVLLAACEAQLPLVVCAPRWCLVAVAWSAAW